MNLIGAHEFSVWGTDDGRSWNVDLRTCRESGGCGTHQAILDWSVSCNMFVEGDVEDVCQSTDQT